MSGGRGAYSLVEMIVTAAVVLTLIAIVSRTVSGSRRSMMRGQDTLTNAQHLSLISSHLRSDLAAVDADPTNSISSCEGGLTLTVRSGVRVETVEYHLGKKTHTLYRRANDGRLELGRGCVTNFESTVEADWVAPDGTRRTATFGQAGDGRIERLRVRVVLVVKASDESRGDVRAQARTLTIVSTPVRMNRRLASRWPQPRIVVATKPGPATVD